MSNRLSFDLTVPGGVRTRRKESTRRNAMPVSGRLRSRRRPFAIRGKRKSEGIECAHRRSIAMSLAWLKARRPNDARRDEHRTAAQTKSTYNWRPDSGGECPYTGESTDVRSPLRERNQVRHNDLRQIEDRPTPNPLQRYAEGTRSAQQ